MRLPDMRSEEHRYCHHLKKIYLLWNVLCDFFFLIVPGNYFLRLDLEELFRQVHIRCLLCARHSGHRQITIMGYRPEYTPHHGKELSNYPFIHSFIEKYFISANVCQALF